MTVDAKGFLWVAFWEGGAVRRYHPSGRLDREYVMPVSQPTSCAFGGPDLRDLFVTTASEEFTPERRALEPHAGGVFHLRVDVAGRAPFRLRQEGARRRFAGRRNHCAPPRPRRRAVDETGRDRA